MEEDIWLSPKQMIELKQMMDKKKKKEEEKIKKELENIKNILFWKKMGIEGY